MINITYKEKCSGCHACINACPNKSISMEVDTEGFWYPKVNIKDCIGCGLCEIVCPIINKKDIRNKPKAYACFIKNEQIRFKSSSGGLFTLIAEHIINNGGVVFGAKFNDEFYVSHSYTETIEGLNDLRGSKYIQSKIGNSFELVKNYLEQGRYVLFTGTPCQIGGLKSYLQKDYTNLVCADNICHGVPSPKVWKSYVNYQENNYGSTLREVNFRRKDNGWKQYAVNLLFSNGFTYNKVYKDDLYIKVFLNDICLRPSCYACSFKTLHRESDFTLADFWGIQKILPELDDDKGTSLIIINSVKGQKIFDKIRNLAKYQEVDIEKAILYNSAAIISANKNQRREEFFEKLDRLSFDKLARIYCTDNVVVKVKRGIKKAKRFVTKFIKK